MPPPMSDIATRLSSYCGKLPRSEIKGAVLGRKIQRPSKISPDKIDAEKRTVTMSVSSEFPVTRWWGDEILNHSESAIDLSRMSEGAAPALWNHDHNKQIGIVERAWIEDRKLWVEVRFGRNARADEAFLDVQDGILRNVSIGYKVLDIDIREAQNEGESDTWNINRWLPYEMSFAPVPADPTVGLRSGASEICDYFERRFEESTQRAKDSPKSEPETRTEPEEEPNTENNQSEDDDMPPKAANVEVGRSIDDFLTIGREFGEEALALEFFAEGKTAKEFASEVAVRREKQQTKEFKGMAREEIGMTQKETNQFSVKRAILALQDGNWKNAGLEREVSRATGELYGVDSENGFFIPIDVLARNFQRDAPPTAASIAYPQDASGTGDPTVPGIIPTDWRGQNFIDVLRDRIAVRSLGATVLDLQGHVEIPRYQGGLEAQWIGEEHEGMAQDYPYRYNRQRPKFDKIFLTPKSVGTHVGLTRRFLVQTRNADSIILNDMAYRVALGIDKAAVMGPMGNDFIPAGILARCEKVVCNEGQGGPLNWAEVVDMETRVAEKNANGGSLGYLTNARVKGALKSTEVANNTGQMIWGGVGLDGVVNGYKATITNMIPNDFTLKADDFDGDYSIMVYGNWSDLFIGQFGGLFITIDEKSQAEKNQIKLVVNMEVDINLRYTESFTVTTGVEGTAPSEVEDET